MPLLTIINQPGMHHNFLRYVLDSCSTITPPLSELPFTETGTSHKKLNYSDTFKLLEPDYIRPIREQGQGPFVLCVADDLLYFERSCVSREGDRNNDLLKSHNFINWQPWNKHYVDAIIEDYKLEKNKTIPKFILRDSIKKSYLDLKNKGYFLQNQKLVDSVNNTGTDNYFFPVSSFFTLEKFIKELTKLNDKYHLQLSFEDVPYVYSQFAERNQILKNHFVVYEIITAIKNKENIQIPDLDVFQEGYIYAELEKSNDFILMPMINNFYTNTREIIEYLQHYPDHYKAMNPNLPTFNNIPNPFYLWNLKK
jgi:hypothetical protein